MDTRFPAPDASTHRYRDQVAALVRALFAVPGGGSSTALADAQLALYTLDGISEVLEWNNDGVHADELACIWLAYTRWLRTGGTLISDAVPFAPPRPLDNTAVMRSRRSTDAATLTILNGGEMQLVGKAPITTNDSASAMLPVAMLGLLPVADERTVISLAAKTATLTHDAEQARAAAVSCALLLRSLLGAQDAQESALHTATLRVRDWLADTRDAAFTHGAAEVLEAVDAALKCARQPLTLQNLSAAFGSGLTASAQLGATLTMVLHAEASLQKQENTITEILSEIAEYDRALTGTTDYRMFALSAVLLAACHPASATDDIEVLPEALPALDLILSNWLAQIGSPQ
ncbi:ADP-ribosylglycohydrolase family protein [Rothia sp. ZJ932]|uniref:ADP-ribosylglycohydrolase family protein n=1 Tax=Rothia sp. ZJ932 TaxID=2810516 RepID=UPI0019688DA4|nr:ADP-ribosylglycohydrolase family protein [Rothia sp. ZJ932]QRZ62299.1 ADP-ribosylglycohydrolase family protein [Rothia sp. ZJ932]